MSDEPKRGLHVDGPKLVQEILVTLVEEDLPQDARVVDQHVDLPEVRGRRVDPRLRCVRLLGVEPVDESTGGLETWKGLASPVDIPYAQRQTEAIFGEAPGDGRSDSSGSSGEHHDPAVRIDHLEQPLIDATVVDDVLAAHESGLRGADVCHEITAL